MLDIPRERLERYHGLLSEARKRKERKLQSSPGWYDKDGVRQGGLMAFVRYYWRILEPEAELVEGWPLYAVCEHLEACTYGSITRLLINVPPGFMKSLLVDVFWPAWEWGPAGKPYLRYVAFSYSIGLTERDNGKFRDLMVSRSYQDLWGKAFALKKIGESKVTNDRTGSKLATSVGGIGTGERGDRVICDDLHNVKESESETIRSETVRFFRESLSNRLNNMEHSVIIVVMQRVHEADVSGTILAEYDDYVHLMIPMEYEWARHVVTSIGWQDPRGLDDDGEPLVLVDDGGTRYPRDNDAADELEKEREGMLAWPERFPEGVVDSLKQQLGPYAYAAQYRQMPSPRGGGIFQRDWWQLYESPDGKFPPLEYVVASLDGAFTEKEENDPSALTVWGVFCEEISIQVPGKLIREKGPPKLILIDAWAKHLKMHGTRVEYSQEELDEIRSGDEDRRKFGLRHYIKRTQKDWGLIEWVAHTCKRWKVDRLLIEAYPGGITVADEMRRLYGDEQWSVQLEPIKGDKVSRAMAVVPAFSQLLVYTPALDGGPRDWAEKVIDEMEKFPKGKHDDLTDSCTQAIKHLRMSGLIQHPDERQAEEYRRTQHRPKQTKLYPV